MIPKLTLITGRRILQSTDSIAGDSIDGDDDTPLFGPIDVNRPFNTTVPLPFESSMALTILVLLTALFFLLFFSAYLRRFAAAAAAAAEEEQSPDPHRRRPPRSKGGGLDGAAVAALPIVAYGGAAKQTIISEDCAICLSEFGEGESVKLIPNCGHVFHPVCVDTWLASHVTCPLCRSAQLFKTVEEEVCLDVTRDKGVIGGGERSTVGDGDAWRPEGDAGESGCSNPGNMRVGLERSTSFLTV